MTAFVPSVEQATAIAHPATPLLIVAGAGTGKTTVMAERIVHLITTGQYTEDQILGLTFTNKAAASLKERVREREAATGLTGPSLDATSPGVTVTTYHSFSASLVAGHLVELDLHPRTRLLSRAQAWQLLFGVFDEFRFEHRRVLEPSLVVDDGLLLASRCADYLVDLDALVADCDKVMRDARWSRTKDAARGRSELCQVVAAYERRKRERHLIDYGDQIRMAVRLLQDHPEVADALRVEHPVALLDEYQDTNYAQRVLLQAIYPPGSPITAVGDDMQSIYAFRGAHRENILHFTEHFPPVAQTTLTVNRRSGARLVALANRIQANVADALDKELQAKDGAEDTEITCFLAADDAEEAATIAGQVKDVGPPWSESAVLCRKRRQLIPVIVRALEALEIPVTVAGSSGLLDRPEVVDLVSWLEILAGDAPVALLRILRGPRVRIGWRDLAALARHGDLVSAAGAGDGVPDLGAEARIRLAAFGEQRAALAAAAARVPVVELAERIIERTGLWLDAGPKGRENLLRFLDLAEHFSPVDGDADLRSFVEYLHLLDGSDEDVAEATTSGQDAVAVMTVHQAKGLEFATVWVPGLAGKGSSTIFPDNRSAENALTQTSALPWWVRPDPSNLPTWKTARSMTEVADLLRQRNLEEEWRLFYVACTRAERRLTLSAAHWYPGPVTPQGPSSFYEFVAAQHDLVTELFRHAPAATDPAVAAMERRRDDRLGAPSAPSPPTEPTAPPEPAVLFSAPDHPAAVPRPVPVALSVTSLVSYARCPRQFYWSIVRPLPRRPSAAARIGVEVHRRIELRANRQLRLLEPEPEPSAAPGEWGDVSPSSAQALEASFMLSPFAELDPDRVEAPFVLAVGSRLVRGRVDAVYRRDGKVELVDFKTGRRPAAGDGGATTQLDLYALAAVQAWREDPESLRTTFCYLRADGPAELDSSDWNAARLQRVTQQLEASLSRLPDEDFAAVVGAWCQRCDFAEVCPAGRQSLFGAQP